jgi:hypothetical protein
MVGFTLVSRSYYYLRRRSPGPPFPPDHRQAGERGAINDTFPAFLLAVLPPLFLTAASLGLLRRLARQPAPGRLVAALFLAALFLLGGLARHEPRVGEVHARPR